MAQNLLPAAASYGPFAHKCFIPNALLRGNRAWRVPRPKMNLLIHRWFDPALRTSL